MQGIELLRSQSEDFLHVVSGLGRGLEEGINLVLLLELYGSVPGHLAAKHRLGYL